jgi:hypothetical protein
MPELTTIKDLDPSKVLFTICVNDENLFVRCRQYLEALEIPQGITVEIKEIRGAKGLASAYNQAIRESNAKYKFYIHQDTFIYNRQIIADVIAFFKQYPEVGMLGQVGGSKLPRGGIWFENGLFSFGKIWEYRSAGIKIPFLTFVNKRKVRMVRFRPIKRPYQPVLVIDGLFMVTQVDVPWREELYDSFLYYEGPQSLEFIKRGYLVVIPYQKKPWIMHWGPIVERTPAQHQKMWEGIRKNAVIFTREYKEYIGKNVYHFIRKK